MDELEGSAPATPRWVKVFGVVILVLALLFVVVHLAGRGLGGHMHSAGAEAHPASEQRRP